MPNQQKKVLMVTVSYNSSEFLERAIRSAFTQKYDGGITVCVLDNASHDETREIALKLYEEFPELEIIHLETNEGFAGGNNFAIRKFMNDHTYFYLHNPDAYFMNNHTIADLVKVMEQLDDQAILQPIVCNPDGAIATSGNVPFYLGVGGMGNADVDESKPYQVIGSTSGAAMMFSKKVIEKVGLLEELYLAYHEDFEFSLRARLAGFENYLATQVKVYHEHTFSKGAFKFYLMERNRYYQLYEYFDWFSLFFLLPPLLLLDLMITAYFVMNGWFGKRVQTYTHVIANRKLIHERKKELSKFKNRESMIRLYKSLSPTLSTKELAKSGSFLAGILTIINIFFALYYKLYIFVYKEVISKVIVF